LRRPRLALVSDVAASPAASYTIAQPFASGT
jgi:hypothetical protein